ncbi:MAG: hypothetical protein IJP08_03350 [Bacteroidaceae bacterium]|nr:hypothetical protein [Bacteroidaceae bacterium]
MKKSLLEIFKKIDEKKPLTVLEKIEYINYSITNHGGKMENIDSISTSCLCNARCKKRMENKNFICSECYAVATIERYSNSDPGKLDMYDKMERNTAFYSYYELAKDCIPTITSRIFRFESFGDLNNKLQFKNYCMLARVKQNNHCTFALWTKTPDIIADAIKDGVSIPKNMVIVYSIPKKNWIPTRQQMMNIKKKHPFIKKFFVVVTKDFQKKHKIKINCQKKCYTCQKCYTKADRTQLIIELEK